LGEKVYFRWGSKFFIEIEDLTNGGISTVSLIFIRYRRLPKGTVALCVTPSTAHNISICCYAAQGPTPSGQRQVANARAAQKQMHTFSTTKKKYGAKQRIKRS